MAVPDPGVAVYQQLSSTCLAMMQWAAKENWEAFLMEAEQYVALSAELRDINWQSLPAGERDVLAETLRKTQTQIDSLLPHAEARRTELVGTLRNLQNSAKMRRAYGP
ncbi:hypothetical protein WG78_12690 [Amantichitinum ursilacus]|uniref:Flagellar protein FliT n=2 Tax=Amantichitinum ursilacus TaxID=857265 RepID=A0A0N0GNE1_9NEIS|nr:hypothetical protein WG78_12690 [Amantichitinum ursilacus]